MNELTVVLCGWTTVTPLVRLGSSQTTSLAVD